MDNIDTIEELKRKIASLEQAAVDSKNIETGLLQNKVNDKKTSALIETLFDAIPDVLGLQDTQHRILRYNKAGYDFINSTPEKTHGLKCYEILGRDTPCSICATSEVYRTLQPARREKFVKEMGIWLDVRSYPVFDDEGRLSMVIEHLRDITELKKTQEVLIQTEKMMSIGGMAAGMAHEINNPLAGMILNADLMLRRLTNSDQAQNIKAANEAGLKIESIERYMGKRDILKMAETIKKSSLRIARIVDNMLSFARQSDAQVSSHSIKDLLDKTLELAGTDFDLKTHTDFKQLKIVKEYSTVPLVLCEALKIQQVFLNILKNCSQAMQEAGTESPCLILRLWFDESNTSVVIEIEDNGPGMDKKTQAKIFEPFFTTKPVGIGTGLGLSVSYFIITKAHNGKIEVTSKPGHGCKFTIRLKTN